MRKNDLLLPRSLSYGAPGAKTPAGPPAPSLRPSDPRIPLTPEEVNSRMSMIARLRSLFNY